MRSEKAISALRTAYGASAEFRAGQLEAIQDVVDDRARVLLVQRTGWGKSVVYFVATRLLRDEGLGPTLIVSPLLALMRDQLAAAARMGLRAVTINSSNKDDWDSVELALKRGSADLLLVSPERFNNPDFRSELLPLLLASAGLLVVDEAHCISDWGHDFRPDYRRLSRLVDILPASMPILSTTATANDRVIEDIVSQFGSQLVVRRGPLDRESLELHALTMPTKAQRLGWLCQEIPRLDGTGIVYCLTIGDCERVASWLLSQGIEAVAYSGDTPPEDRLVIESDLRENRVKVVCATSALGMGFDKPDLGFVIHFQSPPSVLSYYQQVGRAGRSIPKATAVLLAGREDDDIWEYFLETSMPIQVDAELVVSHLTDVGDWVSLQSLESHVNLARGRLTGLLKVLEVEGAVEHSGSRYRRSLSPWVFDVERVERVKRQRVAEQEAMRRYIATDECRMRFIRRELDDSEATECGRCDNCTGNRFPEQVSPTDAVRALEHIRAGTTWIEPRLRWPGGRRSGAISGDELLRRGRALSTLGDGAWGDVVLNAKRNHEPFPDELIAALGVEIRRWRPYPAPEWVTFVPSSAARSGTVEDLAERLARLLSLPVTSSVHKPVRNQVQKLMHNSQQQLANVIDAFTVDSTVPSGPVLLVDDVVDSRWTLTVVGGLLRRAGAESVLPVALARASG